MENSKVGPMLSTFWSQGYPYNEAVKNKFGKSYPTGCVATAIAQIMKYYRKPLIYNWNNMPPIPSYSNYWDVANLMLDIGIAVDMDYDINGSGAKDTDAVKFLKASGYGSASLVSHNQFTLQKQLLQSLLVYSSGTRIKSNGEKVGHAWVCDGIDDYYARTAYYLMTLNQDYQGKLSYIPHEIKFDNEYGFRYFHMNWGYSGDGNGWFRDADIKFRLEYETEDRNYNIDRKDIINIY